MSIAPSRKKYFSFFTKYTIVNYYGWAPYPAKKELRLSNLFKESESSPYLELKVTVININHPDNKDFLDACYVMRGYGNAN